MKSNECFDSLYLQGFSVHFLTFVIVAPMSLGVANLGIDALETDLLNSCLFLVLCYKDSTKSFMSRVKIAKV
jgi:hypothetical protein